MFVADSLLCLPLLFALEPIEGKSSPSALGLATITGNLPPFSQR